MSLKLQFRDSFRLHVDLAGVVTPTWMAKHSLAEIERREVSAGNEFVPLAELFAVSGDPTDMRIELSGDMPKVANIGGGMSEGTIHVEGSVGRHAGGGMSGGELIVNGDAGDWLGFRMSGGRIRVSGNAGRFVAAAAPGEPRGMTGGEIFIGGDVGSEVGQWMRRGLIAIGGDAGESAGSQMLAGTILVFGRCGPRPGIGMRRGTIGVFTGQPELPLTFRRGNRWRPQFMQLLLTYLRQQSVTAAQQVAEGDYVTHHGDMLALGRGEIFVKDER